jgi:tetratricopeptide (TPR) repeat protein
MQVPVRARWTTKRLILVAAGVFVFASLLYITTLQNTFVWDDLAFVENPAIRSLDGATVKSVFTSNYWAFEEATSSLYRPLSALSLHADYQLYGKSPAGFHLTNVLLNAAVCTLVFLVLVQMFARPDVALMTAVYFAAFPPHVENVAWVSGRTDLIATLLMLATLGCYLRWRRTGGVVALMGVPVFFTTSLLAKELAVILPLLLAVIEFGVLREQRSRRSAVFMVVLLLVIVALYFALRAHVLGSALSQFHRFSGGAVQHVAFSLSILAHYVYKLVLPFHLSAEADFLPPPTFWNLHTLAGLTIVALTALAAIRWHWNAAVVFGVAVLALGLAPVLNILPLNQVMAERFLYFPSLGFALLISLVAAAGAKRWRPVLIVFALFVAACSARTVVRNFDWKDDLTLFQKTVATNGNNARARANLGGSYYQRERYEEAEKEYRRATELNPQYAAGWGGLAETVGKLGRMDEALEYIQTAIELRPDNVLFRNDLGMLLFRAGDYAGAAESFRRALELSPGHPHARFNLGLALYQQQDYDGAVREFSALNNKETDFANAYFFLAESEARRGNAAKAAHYATEFLSLHAEDDALGRRARELAAPQQ